MIVRLLLLLAALSPVACDGATPGRSGTQATGSGDFLTFSLGGAIWRLDVSDGAFGELTPSLVAGVTFTSPSYSPDGKRIAYVTSDGQVLVADAGDVAHPAFRIDLYDDRSTDGAASDWSLTPRAVHWSPNGTLLLVTRQRCCGSGLADVVVVRPDGSGQRTIIEPSRLPSFPEATWSEDRSPDGRPPSIIVVGGEDSLSGIAYDTDGHEIGAALPSTASRYGVASHQDPAGEGVLIASALGNPEPFGPVEVIDITGASRIIGGGCGAAWSPDGRAVAYYDGYGIVVQTLENAPGEGLRVLSNAALSFAYPDALHAGICAGFSMTWREVTD